MRDSMPIMNSKYLSSMPMAMLDEMQARRNHGQPLERLAERGGICPAEALAIMDNLPWGRVSACEKNDQLLARRVARYKASQ